MAHAAPALGNTGHMLCVPHDVPEIQRPMAMAWAHLKGSDKPLMGSIASPQACTQVMDMATLAVGRASQPGSCDTLHLLNASPPLTYKSNPLQCLRTVALRQQASMVSSYMMMGATAPVTLAGTLIQGYAEVLAGLALTQLWSPGSPVIMGLFATPFHMRAMLPSFSDPSAYTVQMFAVALARRLGVPVRGDGGVTSAKIDDAQAGAEAGLATAISAWAGADFVLHSAGWLAQGRCVCLKKFERECASMAQLLGEQPGSVCPPPLALEPAIDKALQALLALQASH
jgi:trimethylamine--corrinoid protein Co-methyltransferase